MLPHSLDCAHPTAILLRACTSHEARRLRGAQSEWPSKSVGVGAERTSGSAISGGDSEAGPDGEHDAGAGGASGPTSSRSLAAAMQSGSAVSTAQGTWTPTRCCCCRTAASLSPAHGGHTLSEGTPGTAHLVAGWSCCASTRCGSVLPFYLLQRIAPRANSGQHRLIQMTTVHRNGCIVRARSTFANRRQQDPPWVPRGAMAGLTATRGGLMCLTCGIVRWNPVIILSSVDDPEPHAGADDNATAASDEAIYEPDKQLFPPIHFVSTHVA